MRQLIRMAYRTIRKDSFSFSGPVVLALFLLVLLSLPAAGYCRKTARSRTPATQRPYVQNGIRYVPLPHSRGYVETGIASWYGPNFHGHRTSNGEIYDMYKPTAAHKILPMNTMVLVTNTRNGRQTMVRINDRGPFVRGRIIDLSHRAAKAIGLLKNGTAQVKITALMKDQTLQEEIPDLYRGKFYVQIGAFAEKTNADRLQKRFKKWGHTAVIREFRSDTTTLFRVQVWVGHDLRFARKAQRALLDKGYKQAFVIAR